MITHLLPGQASKRMLGLGTRRIITLNARKAASLHPLWASFSLSQILLAQFPASREQAAPALQEETPQRSTRGHGRGRLRALTLQHTPTYLPSWGFLHEKF